MKNPTYQPEPPADAVRVGIKVKWLYFKDEEAAKAAVPVARHNASVAAGEGYDFGYQMPGSLRLMAHEFDGRYLGMWEVCFP